MSTDRPASSETTAWAKLYAERDKNDGLSRENNLIRGDRDEFQRAFSYLLGFAMGVSERAMTKGEHRRFMEAYAAARILTDEVPFRAGLTAGNKINRRQEHRAQTHEANRWAGVAQRHGFQSVRELHEALRQVTPCDDRCGSSKARYATGE